MTQKWQGLWCSSFNRFDRVHFQIGDSMTAVEPRVFVDLSEPFVMVCERYFLPYDAGEEGVNIPIDLQIFVLGPLTQTSPDGAMNLEIPI
jgi:hypothetical protein